MKTILILLLIVIAQAYGQKADLAIFKPLAGHTWKAEGAWGNGGKFKQETKVEFSLDSTLVIVYSKGFTNQKQTEYGPRNHGIRQVDQKSNTIKFWEFDVFGGCTEGTVAADGKNIRYQYQYGDTVVTDQWEYVDDNTYNFIVGSYEDGQWKQVYLKTQFKRID